MNSGMVAAAVGSVGDAAGRPVENQMFSVRREKHLPADTHHLTNTHTHRLALHTESCVCVVLWSIQTKGVAGVL